MTRRRLSYKQRNILSMALLSFFCAQVLHESVHLVFGLLMGFQVSGFHLFAVNIEYAAASGAVWRVAVVEAMASIVNILVCLIAAGVFYRVSGGYAKLAAMLSAGFHGMMGFGYLLFDGLFYTPGAAGDWKTVLDLYNGNVLLRVGFIAVGAAGYMALFFWLGKAPLAFLLPEQRGASSQRARLGLWVLLIPYAMSIALTLPLAYWHPLGFPEGFFVVFFHYVFGYSGFVTAFFMLWQWLKPTPFLSANTTVLEEKRNRALWSAAALAFAVQLLLAGGLFV